MGTIRGAESTMGSDFDANNRTLGVTSGASGTMRREINEQPSQQIRTEYDKPWMSKEDREAQSKDYLRETAQIHVDLNPQGFDQEQELPSSELLIQHTPP